ncbi:helix-turn-helix transcriptional regulator [Aliarcobacter butzleri]|uniref:helix-turn-helix transcriptional regulator n=1 Tax=Aliarcobacter butzleri TaxID=28197 RepID=UPI001EDBB402|nr:helix-turn-helix domain-containing protein [Aliarcobacter butzleri]MCG3710993.1 helix-turn-helix domain-containing protein [Aliarcobacter butzleri]MCG3714347.1 helix-turn-helix domain-containing protein [Aliarcobacter butzleri]MDN5086361.1 helix-turn-helix domain-containing protein [Aliarcobacter butzleri]
MDDHKKNQTQKYMRVGELSKYLGIGKSTIWLYVRQGKINSKKISSYITLFDVEEVEKALLQ